ncbi:response regulator [Listeria grayi]|uniref:Response regulator receiver domain protein n=2 Tax=Listeria grayi TaxID=1641 RepID=D7UVG1_LISGR|nr:response regulator transcription factor [Listeria grayi]EFI84642.1 response regulator receiver domain protein [Listeria grayi DSM 20601]MBC1922435.1 response regulator transcription factor [Listeria grayi]STY42855.1 Nitrogen regulation protein C [Listeria grayi]
MIKLLLADDNAFITGGLEIILDMEADIEVAATVANGQAAVDYCLEYDIDVALLDVRMPVMNGVEAAKRITAETETKVIILTTFDDDAYIIDAIRNGAEGYLLKNNDPKIIIAAVRGVVQNQNIMQAEIWEKVKVALSGNQTKAHMAKLPLTSREQDVIQAVASGLSNKEIAKKLFISEGTVANNISALLNKLGLEHRTQLAIFYLTGKAGGTE